MYQMMDFKTVFTVFEVFSVDYRSKNSFLNQPLIRSHDHFLLESKTSSKCDDSCAVVYGRCPTTDKQI